MSNDNENQNIQHISVKVPEFADTYVQGWFNLLEAQFALRSISQESTKFFNLLSSLPPSVISNIPKETINSRNYGETKAIILQQYEKSKPEMLEKLLASTTITGRPSERLQEMITLADKVGASHELIRHKFFKTLPPNIAQILASHDSIGLQAMGRLANDLMAIQPYNNYPSVHEIEAKPKSYNNNSMNRNQYNHPPENIPFPVRPFKRGQRTRVCRAHLYYAEDSRTCKSWCRWHDKSKCKITPSSRSSSPVRHSSNNQSPN